MNSSGGYNGIITHGHGMLSNNPQLISGTTGIPSSNTQPQNPRGYSPSKQKWKNNMNPLQYPVQAKKSNKKY